MHFIIAVNMLLVMLLEQRMGMHVTECFMIRPISYQIRKTYTYLAFTGFRRWSGVRLFSFIYDLCSFSLTVVVVTISSIILSHHKTLKSWRSVPNAWCTLKTLPHVSMFVHAVVSYPILIHFISHLEQSNLTPTSKFYQIFYGTSLSCYY